jgi:hypothetical protein
MMFHMRKSQVAIATAINARPLIVAVSTPRNAALFANFVIPAPLAVLVGVIETET